MNTCTPCVCPVGMTSGNCVNQDCFKYCTYDKNGKYYDIRTAICSECDNFDGKAKNICLTFCKNEVQDVNNSSLKIEELNVKNKKILGITVIVVISIIVVAACWYFGLFDELIE